MKAEARITPPTQRARPGARGHGIAIGKAAYARWFRREPATWAPPQPQASEFVSCLPTGGPEVALTFDDGPSSFTPDILKTLREYDARATFFVLGRNVARHVSTLHRALAGGNELGNHTFNHVDLLGLSDGEIRRELVTTQSALRDVVGSGSVWFRPPYGSADMRGVAIAASLGLRTVTWSVNPEDWSSSEPDAILNAVIGGIHPGAIVLLHDHGPNSAAMVAALPAILEALTTRGMRTVTLSEAFGEAPQACDPTG